MYTRIPFIHDKGLAALVLLFSILIPVHPAAEHLVDVLVVSSADAPIYQSVTNSLQDHLATACNSSRSPCTQPRVKKATLKNWSESVDGMHPNSIIITLGRDAAEQVVVKGRQAPHLLNALIPKAAVEQHHDREQGRFSSSIYLDQPIDRQLKLASIISPGGTVGVLLGSTTEPLRPLIYHQGESLGIAVQFRNILKEETIGPSLKELLNSSDILLALPDPQVYSRKNVFNILLSSYQSKIPVIGFSSAYVKAGAIAAVYSSPEDIGHHLADTIIEIRAEDGVDSQHSHNNAYPRYFSVDINASVANSLGRELPDKEMIIKLLSTQGKNE